MLSKRLKRILLLVVLIPLILLSILLSILFAHQDEVVSELMVTLNEDFRGEIEIKDSHISPFADFPYISIDLEDVKIYPDKEDHTEAILHIEDIYLGFSLLDIIGGKYDVKSLKLKGGFIHLVQHKDGSFNVSNALETTHEIEDLEEEFHIHLKHIKIDDVDINKLNEENNIMFDAYVVNAESQFKSTNEATNIHLDSRFELSMIQNGDTTFINHKHFEIETELSYFNETDIFKINPSKLFLEGSLFEMGGEIDFKNDTYLDLKFKGEKPNFDLFIAFAPHELIPTLKKYDNKGKVYFDAHVEGKSMNGHTPKVDANFGCFEAYFTNSINKKKLDELQFKGHFTNGDKHDVSTMEFSLENFSAKPEAGTFSGDLSVKNFEAPDIDLKLISQFELDFLAKFMNVEDLEDLKGSVELTMNFRDIIDLEHPERSVEKLNESYYTELKVKDLSFKSPDYHLAIDDIDIEAVMDGHRAEIEHLNIKAGKSDVKISGVVSDFPAIMHHTSDEVFTELKIVSKYIDLYEITNNGDSLSKPVDEQIENLSLDLAFTSTAKSFTESPNLPVGEFFIKNLYAKMKHYPHTLHDFHADVLIDDEDFRVVDFAGMIDKSDFHFNGKLVHYDLWFDNKPHGDTKIEFALNSDKLQLEDIFSYKGENYVPEDYRHEEFDDLKIHGFADLHFKDSLYSADMYFDQVEASMKIHPMRFEKFSGRVHIENEHLLLEKVKGKIGESNFTTNMSYYYGNDESVRKRDNHLYLASTHLDIDQLLNYNPSPDNLKTKPEDHDSVFNIYELPFTDMTFHFDIGHLNYHRYMLDELKTKLRIQKNHFIYIDTMTLFAAGGFMDIKGYFNGSDAHHIYFSPDIKFRNVNLDKLLFKFENFGQDHVVAEQLHGQMSGKMYGKLHMHADIVPIIDDSDIHLDIEVTNGKIENYGPMEYMADYFKDKNLSKIIFDTLRNHIDVTNGVTTIPTMVVNSSLGYVEISGKQDMNYNFEYYLKVPLSMIKEASLSKLFGKKEEEFDPEVEDEIIYKDESKKSRYVNIKMVGTPEDYKITLGKDKSGK